MKMKDLASRYLEQRRPGMGKQTHKNVSSVLLRFSAEWDRTRRVPNGLSEDWVADWLVRYRNGQSGGRGKPVANSTYNKTLECLGKFFEWAIRRADVKPYVLDALQRFREEPKEYLQLSSAQIVHMIETCKDPWERWVLAFASQTLGRDSELRNRKVQHMHLDRGVLDWYREKTVDLDQLPVTQPLAEEWQRWTYTYQSKCGSLQPEWPLVPRRSGHEGVWTWVPDKPPGHGLAGIVQKHASRVSGLPQEALKGQGVHIMRRSMARAFYERLRDEEHPEPLRVVQAQLGHADPKTTRIYIGLKPDREERNKLLVGSNLLWSDTSRVSEVRPSGTYGATSTERDNVTELRRVQ